MPPRTPALRAGAASRAWPGRVPIAGRFELSARRVRNRPRTVERRASATSLRFEDWEPAARQSELSVVEIVASAAPGPMRVGLPVFAHVPRLAGQLCGLERRAARGRRYSIDHGPGGHDDVANAAAGALLLARARTPLRITSDVLATMTRPM